tara:strand:- start:200 stop:628 length:429 start_codon:yes stop_codon:yes gene_type:complete
MDIVDLIQETRATKGQGSSAGRFKFASKDKADVDRSKNVSKGMKSKVRVYDTIMDALSKGFFGQIFSTVGSDRLYVITKQRWGTSDDQRVGDKVAKGFTPGSSTPGSSFKEIKGHAIRTMLKHGKQHSKNKEQVAKGDSSQE